MNGVQENKGESMKRVIASSDGWVWSEKKNQFSERPTAKGKIQTFLSQGKPSRCNLLNFK